jgi:hypothetical protein
MADNSLDQEVRLADGYVLVLNKRVASVERAAAVCEAIDHALVSGGVTRVLFDTRETEAPSDDVRELMWAWCAKGTNHDRLAIVAQSEATRVSGRMTAISRGVNLCTFSDVEAAAAWLRS